jgi:hypothetical protein
MLNAHVRRAMVVEITIINWVMSSSLPWLALSSVGLV